MDGVGIGGINLICKKCENIINSGTKCFQCGHDNKVLEISDSATLDNTKQSKNKKIIINIVTIIWASLMFLIGLVLFFLSKSIARGMLPGMYVRAGFEYIIQNLIDEKAVIYQRWGIIISIISGFIIILNTYFVYKKIKESRKHETTNFKL